MPECAFDLYEKLREKNSIATRQGKVRIFSSGRELCKVLGKIGHLNEMREFCRNILLFSKNDQV